MPGRLHTRTQDRARSRSGPGKDAEAVSEADVPQHHTPTAAFIAIVVRCHGWLSRVLLVARNDDAEDGEDDAKNTRCKSTRMRPRCHAAHCT